MQLASRASRTRLGLWSGPFAGRRHLLGAGPPTNLPMGHRALLRLELLRAHLTPRSASVRFSLCALMAPLPLPGLPDGPVLPSFGVAVSRQSLGTLRGLPRSHGRRCRTIPARSTYTGPLPLSQGPFPCCRNRGHRLRMSYATSPPVPALHGFTARSGLVLRLLPLRTPPRDDALGVGYSTKTAKR